MKKEVALILILILLCSSIVLAGPLDFLNLPGAQKNKQQGGPDRSLSDKTFTRPSLILDEQARQQFIQAKIQSAQAYTQTMAQTGQGAQLTAARCQTLLLQNPTPDIQRRCQKVIGQQNQATANAQVTLTLAQCQSYVDQDTMSQLSLEDKQTCQQLLSSNGQTANNRRTSQTTPTLTASRCQILLQNDPTAEIQQACQDILGTTAQATPIGQIERVQTQQVQVQAQEQTQELMDHEECFTMYHQKSQGESFGFNILQQCQNVIIQNKNSLTAVECQRILEWDADGEVFIPEILQACNQKTNDQTQLSLDKSQCFKMQSRYVNGENIDQDIINQCSIVIADDITEEDCPKVLNINSRNSNIFSITTVQFCQQRNNQQIADNQNQPRTYTNLATADINLDGFSRTTGFYLETPPYTIFEAVIEKISERFSN